MAQDIEGNSEAGFMFASQMEFIHLWKSEKKSTMSLTCEDGKATINFKCSLGYPDQPHIKDGRCKRKIRVKSDIRKTRDNARTAAFQAAMASPPEASPGPSAPSTTTRTATTSALSSTSKFGGLTQQVWPSPISDSSKKLREGKNNSENNRETSGKDESWRESSGEDENHHENSTEDEMYHESSSVDENSGEDQKYHENFSKDNSETENRRTGETMPLQEMRTLLAILLKKMTPPVCTYMYGDLEKVASGTLLIDQVLEDSLLSSGRKPFKDNTLSEGSILKKNIEILFEWIYKEEVLREIRKDFSVEELLESLANNMQQTK